MPSSDGPTPQVAVVYSGFYGGRGEGVVQHITQLERTLPRFGSRAAVISLESVPLALRYLPHAVQYAGNAVAPPAGHFWRLSVGRLLLRSAYGRLERSASIGAVIFEDIYLPFRTRVPALVVLHALQSDTIQHFALDDATLARARRRDAEAVMRCQLPIAVVSDAYRDHVTDVVREATGTAPDLDVIPLGIDVDRFPFPPERRPDGELRLVYLGYLEARKNVLFLPRLMQDLLRRYHGPARLTIAGDGPLRASLQAEVDSLGVTRAVSFIGRVPRDDVPRLLRSHHLMIHPSLRESFSQTLLEGKLAGLRTLATRGLEVPDEFVDVPLPLDAGIWAEAIADLAPTVIGSAVDEPRIHALRALRERYSRLVMVERTLAKLRLR